MHTLCFTRQKNGDYGWQGCGKGRIVAIPGEGHRRFGPMVRALVNFITAPRYRILGAPKGQDIISRAELKQLLKMDPAKKKSPQRKK